jgi:hypothetical protein
MNPNWAEENLQTIRTLMERSALYRRALAPIMLAAGLLGVVAATVGIIFDLNNLLEFETLWLSTAVLAVAGAFFIARRQAMKDKEPFWSPPTRRVTQALLPPLLAGLTISLFPLTKGFSSIPMIVVIIWILCYGVALHSAAFFMPRGIKFLGWLFIGGACVILYSYSPGAFDANLRAYWLMGFFFGVLHLAFGVYLYVTEKRKTAA